MMKIYIPFSILLTSFVSLQSSAQYYYKDILSNEEGVTNIAAYKANKVKVISIKSLEFDGSESEGFYCQKKFSKDYKTSTLFTKSDFTGASEMKASYNAEGKLVRSTDSSTIAVSRVSYTYAPNGKPQTITTLLSSSDDDFTNELSEQHIYAYNEKQNPTKMLLIKNKKDTTIIFFSEDENGNVGIEKNATTGNKFYYYYNTRQQLTDIVLTSENRKGLHPEYLFEYSNNQLNQMTVTQEGGSNFLIWKYAYDNGMRVREKCYGKDRKLMGSIVYEYK